MRITLKAHAKINWALNITGRRDDGYHLLDMLMQSISLCDILTFEDAEELTLTVTESSPPDSPRLQAGISAGEDNLVLRAARALKAHTGYAGGAAMALEKRVPSRAGLGGGSADCAAALTGLNRLWGLGLSHQDLVAIGAGLGADVPFCLTGGLARVRGVGEIVEPIEGAPEVPLLLVPCGGGLSTPGVYRRWDEGPLDAMEARSGADPEKGISGETVRCESGCRCPEVYPGLTADIPALISALSRKDLSAPTLGGNALTAPAIDMMPQIGRAIEALGRAGATATFMTGSGSCVVGAFDSDEAARQAALRLPGALTARTLGREM